jgi:hypothetical protein
VVTWLLAVRNIRPPLLLQGRKVMQMMIGTAKAQQQQAAASSRADSIKSLPAPTDPAVRLAVAGGEIVAVMPFEGYITPEVAAAVRQKLADALKAGKRQVQGQTDPQGSTVACYIFSCLFHTTWLESQHLLHAPRASTSSMALLTINGILALVALQTSLNCIVAGAALYNANKL